MTFTYTLDNIPEGTTHVWLAGLNKPPGIVEPLAFYRKGTYKKDGLHGWLVHSRYTGWRLSMNGSEWYAKEKAEGFLVTVKRALKNNA